MSRFSPEDSIEDLTQVLRGVSTDEMQAFEDALLKSRRVFVTGLGRTGLMARGFAMRLMHLGRRVYHVGDVITPAIRQRDLLVICTRTGGSKILLHYIEIARRAKARVAVVTSRPDNPVAEAANVVLTLSDEPVLARRREGGTPGHPLGSLFEQALLVVLDQVVMSLMERLELTEGDLAKVHTTFE